MRIAMTAAALAVLAAPAAGQAPGKWPPDSLVNPQVFPRGTPVMQVVGVMRDFAGALGVRCHHCHVGEEGMPLARHDFASDEKRTKQVARQMMRMVAEINRRIDTLPEGPPGSVIEVTCRTCHRGVSRPLPLTALLVEAANAGGADSAVRVYRSLRERYHGRDAYDFGESSLSGAGLRLARAGRFDEALALLGLNEEHFPGSSGIALTRGTVVLLRGDTTAAAEAFREALRRNPRNGEARERLRAIGQTP